MKISIIDKGAGIATEFAKAIGAKVDGRFIHIPAERGSGYLTGFTWGRDLRMMIRNYHLHEEVIIERTNELAEDQEDVVFLLCGIFPSAADHNGQLLPEQANLMICRHAVSSIMNMPGNTLFGSVTIAVSKQYLKQLFGRIFHPVVISVLDASANFVFETSISAEIIDTSAALLRRPVPEIMESEYYCLKCNELLYNIFTILLQRETVPSHTLHITDIKAIYAIKRQLQEHPEQTPNIAVLAQRAGMSQPKLRKIFKQTFGKGVFEYYQSARMLKASQLLKERRLTVAEVGYELGFTNLSHFSRVFKEHWGTTPKKYSVILTVDDTKSHHIQNVLKEQRWQHQSS